MAIQLIIPRRDEALEPFMLRVLLLKANDLIEQMQVALDMQACTG